MSERKTYHITGWRYSDVEDGIVARECKGEISYDFVGTKDEALIDLGENHPEFFMGANLKSENDFCAFAVPCIEYGKGNFETEEDRIRWVRSYIGTLKEKRERKVAVCC